MTKELTAEEYLDTQLALGWDYIDIETAETYGDLRAKEAVSEVEEKLSMANREYMLVKAELKRCKEEAVEEFARELLIYAMKTKYDEFVTREEIILLAKQHGVNL